MDNRWFNHSKFYEYEKICGSTFGAIIYISKIARKRRIDVGMCVSESEALTWVITGVEPKQVSIWRNQKSIKIDKALVYAQDRLMYVEDTAVRLAAERSIELSRSCGHLIYRYKGLQNQYQKSRVRVLCNIIWDEMKKIDTYDMI